MKYILIIGSKDSGKSTSLNAICKELKPSRIFVLRKGSEPEFAFFEEVDKSEVIYNGTYIIEVKETLILIMAGSPTEQDVKVTTIFEICNRLQMTINFALIAMRSFEKRAGYDTKKELELLGKTVLVEKIYRINDSEFDKTNIWKSRIDKIIKFINENI